MTERQIDWSVADDQVCFEEYYDGGLGWERRSAERLDDRTAADCERRAAFLHISTSARMRTEMRRQGLSRAHA